MRAVLREVPDDELVKEVCDGRTDRFTELVLRHQRQVWQIALQLGRDRLATENLVQQAFLNAYERLDRYELGRDFGRWLRAITRNLLRNELRSASRESHHLSHYHNYLMTLYEDEDGAVQRQRQREQAIAACREALAPTAARAVQLRYDEAWAVEQVAVAIGKSTAATLQVLRRARIAIRLCVEKKVVPE